MSNEILKQLSEPFAPEMERTMSKGGTRLTYIPVSEVINRLNKVIGVDAWSFQVISCQRDMSDPDFIVAHVTLTATIDGKSISRDGIGGQKIKRTKKDEIVDLGDEFKGAVSDALKKAAQTLGIGLYLARSDDAMDIEEAMESSSAPQIDPQIEDKWSRFAGLAKGFSDEQKAILNDFWVKFSGGKPKPSLATVSNDEVEALVAEAVRISMNGDYVITDN
jgi:hypothetical protein